MAENIIRLALTKGRIETEAIKLLDRAGYDCSSLGDDVRGRKLFFEIGCGEIEVVLAKAADVITYVEHGVCDCGIVGEDTIMESPVGSFYEIADLGFGKCRFALAGPVSQAELRQLGNSAENKINNVKSHLIIASKYPSVTKDYFNSRGLDVEVVKIEGSVELAPLLGLADAIVDIVETGSTLKANGLEIYEEIASVSARLIVNTATIKLKKNKIDEFTERIVGAIKNENL